MSNLIEIAREEAEAQAEVFEEQDTRSGCSRLTISSRAPAVGLTI